MKRLVRYKIQEKHNLLGKTFGNLTVISLDPKIHKNHRLWLCKCICGGEILKTGQHLVGYKNNGCKQCHGRRMSENSTTHGFAAKRGTLRRLYQTYTDMKKRCTNPKNKSYSNYGGKGISLYKPWSDDYSIFRDWAIANGYADNLTLERKNANGHYEPRNCEWITRSENAKRISGSVAHKKLDDYIFGQLCMVG